MLNIGCHLSVSNGFLATAKTCTEINANTFQFFTRNPRGGGAKKLDEDDIKKFVDFKEEKNFAKVVAHAPYTMNICSSREDVREFSRKMMIDDLERMEHIPGNLYNFHPGSHTGQGIETGIEKISKVLNEVLKKDMKTKVLLETMASKGSEVGGKFEEIGEIMKRVSLNEKLGVCLDTCHIYDAGYDIVNNLDAVMEEFDKKIGIDKLCAIHLNDSKNALGSKKDRHEKIGQGYIGFEAIKRIINRKEFKDLPFILETPQEDISGYKKEIEMIKDMEN